MDADLASDGWLPTSFFGLLSLALGRMTGGMVADGTKFEVGNDSLSLMCLQAMAVEAGMEALVMGAAKSTDAKSSFVAMSDGSIWRAHLAIKEGKLSAWWRKSSDEEALAECEQVSLFADGIKSLVSTGLVESGKVEENDTMTGSVHPDCHAAICMRAQGHGKFIVYVEETAVIRYACAFSIAAPQNADLEDAKSCLRIAELSKEEAEAESKSYKKQLGMDNNPFGVAMGIA